MVIYSQDPYGVSKRTTYMEKILKDLKTKELNDFSKEMFGVDIQMTDKEIMPDSEEELKLHMQLTFILILKTLILMIYTMLVK